MPESRIIAASGLGFAVRDVTFVRRIKRLWTRIKFNVRLMLKKSTAK